MRDSLNGIKFIWTYLKRYWISLIFVAVFIILATWLQVKAPLLMGEAIDDMSNYVTSQYTKNEMNDILESVSKGEGISDKSLKLLSNSMTKEDYEMIDNATNKELQELYNFYLFQWNTMQVDVDSIVNGNGITDKMKAYINTYDISDQYKAVLLNTSSNELSKSYENINKVASNEADITEKYDIFLQSLKYLLFSYIALFIANFIYNMLMAKTSTKAGQDMRNGLFTKLQSLSIRYFDSNNDGDVLSRFTNDIDNITNALNQTLTQVLSQIAMLIGVIWMMFKEDTSTATWFGQEINNALTMQMLIFAFVAIILASFIVYQAQKYVSQQQNKLGELNGFIDETISAQKVIITNGLNDDTVEEFEVFNDSYRDTAYYGQLFSGMLMPMMQGIGLINLGALVFIGANEVASGVMTIGLLTAFIQYSQRFFQPLGQVFSQYNILQLAISGGARAKEVFDESPEIIDTKNAIEIAGLNGTVQLQDVTFAYNEGTNILNNINIDVERGKMIALVGPTGSGKTTVMNLMNRFYDVSSGAILFDGVDIRNITLDSLRRNVGIVLQESVMFSGNIRDNIAYGIDNATDEQVINAAKTANIHDFIMTLDHGYETIVDNSTSVFSFGQKQLISIARTIITDPDLLILDEATSNVDTVTEAKIQKAMENVLKGRTSFVIAHRLKTILEADEIIVLKDGYIIEQGNHQELLNVDGFYAELYKNQFVL